MLDISRFIAYVILNFERSILMEKEPNKATQDMEKLKEIPKWTRKYAQNRTLPVLIMMAISSCLFAGIGISSFFLGMAVLTENIILLWICIVALAISLTALVYFSVPKWGGKFIGRMSQKVYSSEGNVVIPVPENMKKKKWLGYVVGFIFGCCVVGSVLLGGRYNMPIKYMQPLSAIYGVPFLVFLYFWQRPIVSPISLLWPILYTIHAILIVANVPILFKDNLSTLNMIIPVFGYGFLTSIIGHIYSRHALRKLKTITHLEENTTNGD
jgi:hypothetical protein